MKVVLLLVAIACQYISSAQIPFFVQSQLAIGSNAADQGVRYAMDGSGNFLLYGTAGNDIDIAPGTEVVNVNPFGNPDILLVKYDANNAVIWSANFGRIALNSGVTAQDLAIDNNGNIYITGSFQSNVNFNPLGDPAVKVSAGSDDAFIAKYNSDGVLVWFNQYGDISTDASGPIVLNGSDALYFALRFSSTIDLDPGTGEILVTSIGGFDTAILELDLDGNLMSNLTSGSLGNDEITSLAFNGGRVAAGGLREGALTGLPVRSMAFYMFDADLNSLWTYEFNNSAVSNEISHVAFSEDGNDVYIGGRILANTDFDNSEITEFIIDPLFADAFFAKYSVSGLFQWAKYIRSSGTEDYFGGFRESASALIVAGTFDVNAQFIPSDLSTQVESAGGQDIFLAAFDKNNGDYLFANSFGGPGSEFLRNMTFENGIARGIGSFTTSLGIDSQASSINSVGSSDIFIGQFEYDTTVSVEESLENSDVSIYPNPTRSELTIQLAANAKVQSVRFYDIRGVQHASQSNPFVNGSITMNVELFPPGLYLIELETNRGILHAKFVKSAL